MTGSVPVFNEIGVNLAPTLTALANPDRRT
jgi:hypothetical protein